MLRSNQWLVEGLDHDAELDSEVGGKILGLGFAALFAPEAEQGGLVIAYDDAGVRAADERATGRLGRADFLNPD